MDYLIWSNEHHGWWRSDEAGYAIRSELAGRYTRERAIAICVKAMPGTMTKLHMFPEIPVRADDMREVLQRFAKAYPGHDPEPL